MANKEYLETPDKRVDNRVAIWLSEIASAKKREKDFRKNGERILKIYGGEKPEETPYNILYSNTETLLPALYSAIPRPVVQRRFKDDDAIAKASANAGERVLEFLVDTNIEGYETYDECIRAAVLDGLLCGRGLASVKYDADVQDVETDSGADVQDENGDPIEPEKYKKSELVCTETRSWNRVYFGYAKRWSKVPWICYEEQIDKSEAERLFSEEVAAQLNYSSSDKTDDENNGKSNPDEESDSKTTTIYKIWHKKSKKVIFISPQYDAGYLKELDDPLGLTGFFDMPKPIMFLEKSNDLMPVALYMLYENQAKELNRLTTRINRIVEAIKARGVYDGELGDDIASIMEADDNALVAADKSASLAAEKGLGNAIWFMPIEQLTNVLIQLYQAREQCKRVIFEVTGISDIIRGSSVASETATAQTLKSQWGTLRLKRLQSEVQRYARDLLRMMLEIAATKFSEETWAKMTGLPYLTEQQQAQMQQMMMAAQQTGQPPDPQMQEQMNTPAWSDILALLRDDVQRSYRVDIESNSTVQPEATEDQKNIAEVMNALAQYLNGVSPLVQSGALPFEAAQSMLLAITRRFRFGPEIEDTILKMQAPKPPDDGKEAEAAAEQAKQQQEMAKMQMQQQADQMKMQAENQRYEQQQANEMQRSRDELDMKKQIAIMEIQAKKETEIEKATIMARTQMMTAQISAGEFVDDSDDNETDSGENTTQKFDIKSAFTMLTQAVSMLAQPKETMLITDETGKAIGSRQIPSIQVQSSEELQ